MKRMNRETVITHLQIIHTWAEFARERDLQFFTPKHLENMAKWSDDAIAMLKEQEAVVPNTGHWIYKKYDDMFMCSCCEKYSIRNNYPFCHWCGAKMDMDDEVE